MGLDSRVTLLVVDDGSSLTFDVCETAGFNPTIDVTEHPLEDGAVVSDHAQIRALNWTARCGITESPYDHVIRGDAGAKTGQARLAATLQFLRRVQGRRLFFSSTKTGSYADAMITSWAYEETALGVMWFALAFKQIRIAQSTTVEIPARKPRALQQVCNSSETNSGNQPTTAANDATTAEGASVLHDLFGAVGVDFGAH